MDAFFAAIEQRDHPEYHHKPVVVGGDPFGRGVVSTASYEARKYGIHSAMPAAHARRLCPQAVFLRPRFRQYEADSHTIMAILRQYAERIEPVSLDEAYLDVTENKLGIQDPVAIASLIKQNIFAVTRLTASAGVAPNMFLAKIASDFKKPDGLTVIKPENVEAFLKDLPVRKIPGVGPVTEKELARYHLLTCGDLAGAPVSFLLDKFGKTGIMLRERAQGFDPGEVNPHAEPKQYSVEETFPKDILDVRWLEAKLKEYADEVFLNLQQSGRMGKTIVLKVKYFDFESITRSKTLARDPDSSDEICRVACDLLEKKTQAGKKAVRLLGVGISGLRMPEEDRPVQPDLF